MIRVKQVTITSVLRHGKGRAEAGGLDKTFHLSVAKTSISERNRLGLFKTLGSCHCSSCIW